MNWNIYRRIIISLSLIVCCNLSYAEAVWIDVRSSFEHIVDNIEGDIRISHEDIVEGITTQFPDKETEIHLYCRSGSRSGKAMSALKQAGYTNLTNAGGINDARKQRNLTD